MEVIEKRSAIRHRLDLPLESLEGRLRPGGLLVDLSALGAQVISPLHTVPGKYLPLTFRWPGEAVETTLVGMVVWVQDLPGQPPRFCLGLSFSKPHWELEAKIRSYISGLEAK